MRYIVDHVIDLGKPPSKRLNEIAEIENLDYPEQVEPDVAFDVSYYARNLTPSTLLMWGEMIENSTVIPGSSWQIEVPGGLSAHSLVEFVGRQMDLHGTVVIGHIEEEPPAPPDIWKIATVVFGLGMIGMVGVVLTRPTYKLPKIEGLRR